MWARSQDPEIMTWAEGRCLTNWATQAPQLFWISYQLSYIYTQGHYFSLLSWKYKMDFPCKFKTELLITNIFLSHSFSPSLISWECTFCFNKLSHLCYSTAVLCVYPWNPSHKEEQELLVTPLGPAESRPRGWGFPSSPGNIPTSILWAL